MRSAVAEAISLDHSKHALMVIPAAFQDILHNTPAAHAVVVPEIHKIVVQMVRSRVPAGSVSES